MVGDCGQDASLGRSEAAEAGNGIESASSTFTDIEILGSDDLGSVGIDVVVALEGGGVAAGVRDFYTHVESVINNHHPRGTHPQINNEGKIQEMAYLYEFPQTDCFSLRDKFFHTLDLLFLL